MAEDGFGITPALEAGIESGFSLQREHACDIAAEKRRLCTTSCLRVMTVGLYFQISLRIWQSASHRFIANSGGRIED